MPGHPSDSRPGAGRLAGVGLLGGFQSGLLGVGGGIVIVPLLLWLGRMDQRRASATSLAAIVPTALVGAGAYLARGEVDVVAALAVAVGAVVGSPLGTVLLRRLPMPVLRWAFVALLVATAVQLVLTTPERGAALTPSPGVVVGLVATGVLMGVTAGLFGIGGGIVLVPALVVLFGVDDLTAKGTSLLAIVPAAVSGTIANARAGMVDLRAAAVVGVAAGLASLLGVALAFWLPPRVGAVIFAVVVVVVAVRLARSALADRHRPTD